MDQSTAKSIISSRQLVRNEGKFTARVETVSTYFKESATPGGKPTVAIVNLNLMTPYHKEQTLAQYKQGEYNDACNHKMSIGIREGDYIPSKREVLDVIVIEKVNKDGVPSLFIDSIIPKKAESLSKINMSDFDDEFEGTEIAAEAVSFTKNKVVA